MRVEVTKNNVHIEDSYIYDKREFDGIIDWLREKYPDSDVWKRTNKCLKREWATHNLFYSLHLFRKATRSVDMDYPQNFIVRTAYAIVGSVALLLIK